MLTPPLIQRRVIRREAVSAVSVMVGSALLLIGNCAGTQSIAYLSAPFLAVGFYAGWRSSSLRKGYASLALEHSFLLCGNCAYPLNAVIESTRPERIRCPECGDEASVAAIEAGWREQFEVKPRPPRPFLPASKWARAACVVGILGCLALIWVLVAETFSRA